MLHCLTVSAEPGPNTKSRSVLRSIKKNENVATKMESTSSKKIVTVAVADDRQNDQQNEMELVALSRLLESKQRSYATLAQSSVTLSTVALQVCKEFDMNNQLWQNYMLNNNKMEKQLEEIQELEAKILERTNSTKGKRLKLTSDVDDDGDDVVVMYTTPRSSSLSSTSTLTSAMKEPPIVPKTPSETRIDTNENDETNSVSNALFD